MADLKLTFAQQLTITLAQKGVLHKELAEHLACSPGLVSRWTNGHALPLLEDVVKIAQFLDTSVDELLQFTVSKPTEITHNGLTWIEDIPRYLSPDMRREIEVGIHLFRKLFVENLNLEVVLRQAPFADYDIQNLYCNFQSALRSGALRFVTITRDPDLEKRLGEKFPKLRPDSVIVAAIPEKNEGTLLRAEFVAFLAATQALPSVKRPLSIGFGAGYTLLRMAEQSIPGLFSGITWLPLVRHTSDIIGNGHQAANHIAITMSARNPGTKALRLPFLQADISQGDREKINTIAREWEMLRTAFITVNGIGRKNRSSAPQFHAQLRSADFAEFGDLRDTYDLLRQNGLEEQFAGEMLGYMLNDDGKPIDHPEVRIAQTKTTYQISLDLLQQAVNGGHVWVVAAREYKARAVLAVIRAGLANALVIDSEIAQYMLDHPD